MKRAISIITALLLFCMPVFAEVLPYDTKVSSDGVFEYVPEGVVTAYYGGDVVSIPSEIDGTPISDVGAMLCYDLDVSTVYMYEGIEMVHESAFEGSNITYADIPSTATYIDDRAFANCENLDSVVLNSENTKFGYDVFMGTGYIVFTIPCTADEAALREKISDAKGDNRFEFVKMHTALIESMTEKDIYGANMFYCNACGFKGSKYMEDVNLPFTDVSEDAWYYPYVATAYNYSILSGKSETTFDPDAGLTCAEAAKIAACIHNSQMSLEQPLKPSGEHWYDVYVDYCYRNYIIEKGVEFDWNKNATRGEMAYFFSRCDANPYYINEVPITDIPDVYEITPYSHEILDLYNKGVAVGSNEYYAFYPFAEVKRSEAAVLISKILFHDMRTELPKG